MHLADALISPAVAGVGYAMSAYLTAISVKRIRAAHDSVAVSMMGVLGAFVFVAQMVNFYIPGTGSSGHITGGILLSVLLGPWAAFIVLASVIIVQCLLLSDGGLMALGCNILNMGATSCLIAYPLIYRPLATRMGRRGSGLLSVSVTTCAFSALLGALAVVVETVASGVATLPPLTFLSFMIPIHLIIGVIEGFATAAVTSFVRRYRPASLSCSDDICCSVHKGNCKYGLPVAFALMTLLLTAAAFMLSSQAPDGLEWSIKNSINE
jgi:cobalt/nickel transport system permease protein